MRMLLLLVFLSGCTQSPEEASIKRELLNRMADQNMSCFISKYKSCVCVFDMYYVFGVLNIVIDPSGKSCEVSSD